jgi:hypothetical protein
VYHRGPATCAASRSWIFRPSHTAFRVTCVAQSSAIDFCCVIAVLFGECCPALHPLEVTFWLLVRRSAQSIGGSCVWQWSVICLTLQPEPRPTDAIFVLGWKSRLVWLNYYRHLPGLYTSTTIVTIGRYFSHFHHSDFVEGFYLADVGLYSTMFATVGPIVFSNLLYGVCACIKYLSCYCTSGWCIAIHQP